MRPRYVGLGTRIRLVLQSSRAIGRPEAERRRSRYDSDWTRRGHVATHLIAARAPGGMQNRCRRGWRCALIVNEVTLAMKPGWLTVTVIFVPAANARSIWRTRILFPFA